MKSLRLSSVLLTTVAGLSFMVLGCGGGGGGGGGTASTLTAETAVQLADNIAIIDGCTSTNVGAAPLYALSKNTTASENAAKTRSYPINKTISGSCGGFLNVSGKHDNGTNTMLYNYSDFCMDFASRELNLDGEADVKNKGNPGTWGPVVYEDTASTRGRVDGSVTGPSFAGARGVTQTFSYALSQYSYKYGSGNKNVPGSASTPDTVSISSTDFINGTTGKKYAGSNISASVYVAGNTANVLSATGRYDDPDNGSFTLSTTNMAIPLDANGYPTSISGTVIDITASDGTKGSATINNGMISILVDGSATPAAQVDCTALLNSI